MRHQARAVLAGLVVLGLAGCDGGSYAAKPDDAPASGPVRERQAKPSDTIFGEGGLSLGNIGKASGVFGGNDAGQGQLPVNKYLWQASLDTLSFLPLASTDPFTGVIATDWGSTPQAPGERFKVTAYMVKPDLAASSLKVAVYRESRNEAGLWVPSAVNPDTATKLEDAILTRARQIRIAETTGAIAG